VKTFKRYSSALKYANGKPVLSLAGKLYVVGLDDHTSIELTDAQGHIVGQVTLRHLQRLGNANWADANKNFKPQPWYTTEAAKVEVRETNEMQRASESRDHWPSHDRD
jgi:hypothetical protein